MIDFFRGGTESSRETPPFKGEFTETYFGNKNLMGMVDAVHAQGIDEQEDLDRIVKEGKFYSGRDRSYKTPNSNVRQIFANETMRKHLIDFAENVRKVDDNGVKKVYITYYGKEYRLRDAKKAEPDAEWSPIFVHTNFKNEVDNILKRFCDENTGEIAKQVADKNGTVVIAKVNRLIADLNRFRNFEKVLFRKNNKQEKAIDEYREDKVKILKDKGIIDENGDATKPFLHIAIHGKKDYDPNRENDCDIEIGTREKEGSRTNSTCDARVKEWFKEELIKGLKDRGIQISEGSGSRDSLVGDNIRLRGHESKEVNRKKHSGYFNTIQLEICNQLRMKHPKEIGKILHDLLVRFTKGEYEE